MDVPCAIKWCACLARRDAAYCAVHGRLRDVHPESFSKGDALVASIECEECEGSGDCNDCEGEGEHYCDHAHCYDSHDCSACSGTGQCQTCRGTSVKDGPDTQYLRFALCLDDWRPFTGPEWPWDSERAS
jgi:hypothetical protein